MTIEINQRLLVRVLFLCMILLVAADLAGETAWRLLGPDGCRRYHLLTLIHQFNVDSEENIPTWFSSACLFLCALVLGAIACDERRGRSPLTRYWFVLAGTFLLLSLDEVASFHNLPIDPLRQALHTSGFLYSAWVIPGGLFALGYLAMCWRFLRRLPPESSRAFLVAGFVFCSGAIGMEMVGGRHFSLHGPDLTYSLMTVVEESLEMAGEILFLRALLAYWGNHAAGRRQKEERPAQEETPVPAGVRAD